MLDSKIHVDKIYTQIRKTEKEFLAKLGFSIPRDLHIIDVPFVFRGSEQYIHTLHTGNPNAENLVMLHGVGATGVYFFNLFKNLSRNYNIWSIDLLGQGASTRPTFIASSDPEEASSFFVESIERWRKKLQIEQATFLGHSFGGYLAGMYAIKYPQHVRRIIMVSPAGFSKTSSLKERMSMEMKNGIGFGILEKISFMLLKNKLSLPDLFKRYPTVVGQVIKFYLQSKLKFEDIELFDLFLKYTYAYFSLPVGSQTALPDLVSSHRGDAYIPLEDMLEKVKLDIPIDFYYGEHDPLNYKGVERLVRKGRIKGAVFFVEDGGHQIVFENPEAICRMILARDEGAYQDTYGVVREKRSKIFCPEPESLMQRFKAKTKMRPSL